MAIVALAGPFSNLVMAFLWAIFIKLIMVFNPVVSMTNTALMYMGHIGIVMNLMLGALNLLPIPPLDGSRILAALIPPRYLPILARIEPFGFIILLALLLTNILWFILNPIISFSLHVITNVVGVS
jgi:Zn-dependent protease